MLTQTVKLGESTYAVMIEDGALHNLGELVRPFLLSAAQVAIITDDNVWRLYGDYVHAALEKAGIPMRVHIMPHGERQKSITGLTGAYHFFAEMGLHRDGLILALGGGVVGDLTGFAAATYLRGIRYIQIPTTLLAQVDSSVGGKTAINLEEGKNLAGAFYQPKLVVIDPATLQTLPASELRCGLAEVIKNGIIHSPALLTQLEDTDIRSDASDIIAACCRIKADIVAQDERDQGERILLNFGHTLGHAIEALGGYARYNHGEAVAMGMVIACALGEALHITPVGTTETLKDIVRRHGLYAVCPFSAQQLLPHAALDKKGGDNIVRLVLLRALGDAVVHEMHAAAFAALLERTQSQWH